MDNKLLLHTSEYKAAHKRKTRWTRVFTAMAAVVVFCTTYALILPAITMEDQTFCGLEEHTHSEQAPCVQEVKELTCVIPESGHTHSEECLSQQRTLICTIEEVEPHSHSESCYDTVIHQVCTLTAEGHAHSDACYTAQRKIVCFDSSEEHTHDESCYDYEPELTCDQPEQAPHDHDETCFTMETVLVCEQPETEGHTHIDSCYEVQDAPGCGLPECESHEHTDECYTVRTELVCELPEHEHSLQCFSDPDADVEDPETWLRASESVGLTGMSSDDVLRIAVSQLGYGPSQKNYLVAEDGETTYGYTRFGAWNDDAYGPWNVAFCGFCVQYAGVQNFPYASDASQWFLMLGEAEKIGPVESYTPVPGDLIFFDENVIPGEPRLPEHVAVLAEIVSDDSGNPIRYRYIEGGGADPVRYAACDITSDKILGFGAIPPKEFDDTLTIGVPYMFDCRLEDGTLVSVTAEEGTFPYPADQLHMTVEVIEDDTHAEELVDLASQNDSAEKLRFLLLDIKIFYTNPETGETIEIEPNGPVSLSIYGAIPEDTNVDSVEIEVHHIDREEGIAEVMPVEVDDDGIIVVDTDHFSEYAVTIYGTKTTAITTVDELKAINGNTGAYLANDIVFEGGSVEITANTVLDLNGHKIIVSGNDLFYIHDGGELTIEDSAAASVTVTTVGGAPYGHAATYEDGKLTYYVTETAVVNDRTGATAEVLYKHEVTSGGMIVGANLYSEPDEDGNVTPLTNNVHAFSVNGGTLNINSGYVTNFHLTSGNGGALYAQNSTVNMNGGVVAGNIAGLGGGFELNNSTMNITGGVISGNSTTHGGQNESVQTQAGGGGIFAHDNTIVNMSGGWVTNNLSTSGAYWDGGGAFLLSNSTLNFADGYLTGNQATGGGAIKTFRGQKGVIIMTGGFISGNNSTVAEAGGVNVDANGYLEISGGYVTNNIAGTGIGDPNFQHWGGGGLFCCDANAVIYIKNGLITDNHAGGYGGGVGGCSTGRINIVLEDGCGIYGNDALGEHLSGAESAKNDDREYAHENPVFLNNGYEDYYCALSSHVSGAFLGGGTAHWTGSADGYPVHSDSKDDMITASYIMGLTAHPTEGDISIAQNNADVFINGNTSPTHGGGILANGYLLMGTSNEVYSYARFELQAQKELLDTEGNSLALAPGAFKFALKDELGNEVALGTNDASGVISFDRRLPFTTDGEFTYYLSELTPEGVTGILPSGDVYKMVVKVDSVNLGAIVSELPTIIHYRLDFNNVTIYRINSAHPDGEIVYQGNPGNDEIHAVHLNTIGSDTAIINRESNETMSVVVKKAWVGGDADHRPDVTVYLKSGNANVTVDADETAITNPVILNASNGWTYTWDNLPSDVNYEVQEDTVPGFLAAYAYSPVYTESSSGITVSNEAFLYKYEEGVLTPAEDVVEGEQYVIMNDSQTHMMSIPARHDSALNASNTVQYHSDQPIPDTSVFTAVPVTKGANHYLALQVNAGGSWLLVQNNSGHYLKGTSGKDYSSGIDIVDGHLMGQREWDNGEFRKFIFDGKTFNTISRDQDYTVEEFHSIIGTTQAAVITNTDITDIPFNLNLTKIDENVNERVLKNAQFQLLDSDGNAIWVTPYVKVKEDSNGEIRPDIIEEGKYVYYGTTAPTAADAKETQILVTNNSGKFLVLNMPAGVYTVHESVAPRGYELAPDQTVELNENSPDRNVFITVQDPPTITILPESGSTGTRPYALGGAMLMAFASLGYCEILQRRKRERGRK